MEGVEASGVGVGLCLRLEDAGDFLDGITGGNFNRNAGNGICLVGDSWMLKAGFQSGHAVGAVGQGCSRSFHLNFDVIFSHSSFGSMKYDAACKKKTNSVNKDCRAR